MAAVVSGTKTNTLEVVARELAGSSHCGRIRRSGLVPGNVYGLDRPPFKVSVSPKKIDELLRRGRGVNTVFQLSLVGENRTREAMIKELQRDPVSGNPIHVDFIRIDPMKKIHVRVPVHLNGTPVGVRLEGGTVEFVTREVEVECLPAAIPESLNVDISGLHLNQHVSVSDLELEVGVLIAGDPGTILAVVHAPMVEEQPAAEGADAAAAAPAAGTPTSSGDDAEGDKKA